MSFEAVLTSEVYYMNLEYIKKAHLISDFKKRISPWLGLEPTKMINSCSALFFPSRIRGIIFIMNAGATFRTKVSSNCHDLVTLKRELLSVPYPYFSNLSNSELTTEPLVNCLVKLSVDDTRVSSRCYWFFITNKYQMGLWIVNIYSVGSILMIVVRLWIALLYRKSPLLS